MNSMDRLSNVWRNATTRNNFFLGSGFFAMLFGYALWRNRSKSLFADEKDPLAPNFRIRNRILKNPEFWVDEHKFWKNELPW